MLVDPGAQALRGLDAVAEPAGRLDRGEVRDVRLDRREAVRVAGGRVRRRRSARPRRPPRGSRTGRRGRPRASPVNSTDSSWPTVGIQIPSSPSMRDRRIDAAPRAGVERRGHPHEARLIEGAGRRRCGRSRRRSCRASRAARAREARRRAVTVNSTSSARVVGEQRAVLRERADRRRRPRPRARRSSAAPRGPRRARRTARRPRRRATATATIPAPSAGATLVGARRPARDADAAGCRGTPQRPHPLVAAAPREPQQAREQAGDAEGGLERRGDRRPDRDAAAR